MIAENNNNADDLDLILTALKKTIENNLRKFCEDCECGAGSETCTICVVGRKEALKQLDRKPKTEPPVYLLTDMGKAGIPEIIWFARTREEAIKVMAKQEHPEYIELSYGSSSWLKIMEEDGW